MTTHNSTFIYYILQYCTRIGLDRVKQDHTRTYKTTQGHTRSHKVRQGRTLPQKVVKCHRLLAIKDQILRLSKFELSRIYSFFRNFPTASDAQIMVCIYISVWNYNLNSFLNEHEDSRDTHIKWKYKWWRFLGKYFLAIFMLVQE